MNRFLISAAHKSSGKTTISIGLGAALTKRGLRVQSFKKGPDYIDPMWLSLATHQPCYNLDPYLCNTDELIDAYSHRALGADVCLVEGNKGLHDGIALDGSNSNAAVAAALDLPVILVIDTRGMTRGVAPLILGFQAFDPRIKIAGVILNRTGGKRHESKLRAVIEHYTNVPVIGAIPETPELAITERHLGLVPSNEDEAATAQVARLERAISEHIDLDQLLALTKTSSQTTEARTTKKRGHRRDIRLGIARDAAFGFYYPEDFEALTAAGAELVPFDTLNDKQLPDVDALFIGGGFPEMLAAELEANTAMRHSLHQAIENGLPVYAECGGLMYLSRSIQWQDKRHAMVGAIPADTVMHKKPIGRGYVEIEATADHPWATHDTPLIRAHEFHYSSLENIAPNVRYAWRVRRGHGIDGNRDGIVHRNVLGAYCHLRKTLGNNWPAQFIAFIRACRVTRHAALSSTPCAVKR